MLRVKERKAITLNYVTISPEFQFCSVHYNSTRMCTHYFQHPLIAHLMLRPHCVHTFESYVLRNFLAVCRYASIRLSGAHKSDYRRDRMMLLYMCGHHCEGRRKKKRKTFSHNEMKFNDFITNNECFICYFPMNKAPHKSSKLCMHQFVIMIGKLAIIRRVLIKQEVFFLQYHRFSIIMIKAGVGTSYEHHRVL